MNDLSNKVIWITGASSGIGEALVHECAKQNAIIILSARRESELLRVASQAKLSEQKILVLPFDLADTAKADEYSQQIISKFGKIDILINNGGQSQRGKAIETSMETERHLFEINYFSAVNLSKAVLPFMLKNGSGKIVVISSIAGKFGFYLRSTYSAAKHALHGYFESLRLEVEKQGLSVLMVCPGKIKTTISVNAMSADGGTHNKMDESHENAMSARECAQQIISGILHDEEEILVGGKELLIVKIKRFLPKFFGKLIRKQSPY
ncbi:MAG: short chain dehydrogenase [Bacteroidetes bacterium]|jgi:short-subunit dehydrogenase|nr:short chain dehydrogenase [Bacteroidota bacterium]MDF2451095.1 short chain dehydrogenase [Bacteroidota bacterium]